MINATFGYIVRTENAYGDHWVSRRIYMDYNAALTVKHNLQDTGRYIRVYVVPATQDQFNHDAISILGLDGEEE
jgi:cation diffusion facilitator CzcD-associated flavoprotein CzcO